MCGAHATVRGLLGELVTRSANGRDIILDMEAGLEHLSRGTGRHVSRFLAVIEPYYRSMETARRIAELATELDVGKVHAVANKLRDVEDRQAITAFCATHSLPLIAEIPYDPTLIASERSGVPPIEASPSGPAVEAMHQLARTLTATN